MNIIDKYNPQQGLKIISPAGSQKYTKRLDSYSQIFTDLRVSSNNDNKFCIDSCWESENIYYANYNDGCVKKISYDGTELASITLANPSMVSVIQYSNVMSTTITYPPQDDQGVWIVDSGTDKAIKTDNGLNILYEANTSNTVSILASIDGGCYIVEELNGLGNLTKLSSSGIVQDTMDYTEFSPSITRFKDIVEDGNGILWLCANDKVYKLIFNNVITQIAVINPFSWSDVSSSTSSLSLDSNSSHSSDSFSSSSSSSDNDEVMHIGSIDVDRNSNPQYLYITGGNEISSFIYKYDPTNTTYPLAYQTYDISYSYILKASQGYGSDVLYILEDNAKWDEYGYGSSSSSSSSSSTFIKSSSSSSSSSTFIRSSSSSSS